MKQLTKKQLRKANKQKKCKYMIAIIKGQLKYTG
jgi:hypothetical protein